jgi:hypothetical protein
LRRKLVLLDLALAAIVAVLAFQVRDKWHEAKKRSQEMFSQPVKQLPPPPYAPLPGVPNVTAATYSEVAMKYVFSADRNPTVIVDPPKEKPMPALPVFYGIMTLRDGETAIMSAKASEPSLGVHFGDKVGEFTLVSVNDDEVTLEWDGKKLVKKISELRPRRDDSQAAARAAPKAQPQQQSAPLSAELSQASPWNDIGGGFRACRPGDNSPGGTEKDGWKKVLVPTPMGNGCHWESVR